MWQMTTKMQMLSAPVCTKNLIGRISTQPNRWMDPTHVQLWFKHQATLPRPVSAAPSAYIYICQIRATAFLKKERSYHSYRLDWPHLNWPQLWNEWQWLRYEATQFAAAATNHEEIGCVVLSAAARTLGRFTAHSLSRGSNEMKSAEMWSDKWDEWYKRSFRLLKPGGKLFLTSVFTSKRILDQNYDRKNERW